MFSYPPALTFLLGTQMNCLIEMVLLSIQSILFGCEMIRRNYF